MRETLKKINLKSNRGITLIALMVTLIVIVILAGVSISMLSGDNGILRQAASAKTKNDDQTVLEKIKIASITAMMNKEHEVNKNILDEELRKIGYDETTGDATNGYSLIVGDTTYTIEKDGTVTDVTVVTDVVTLTTAVSKKTIYKDESAKNTTTKQAVIPKGFKVSSVVSEQHIDTGLVVIAPDGSEFVWVPVDDVTTMYGTLADGTKAGKLYDWENLNADGTPKNLNWTEDANGVMSITSETGNREPVLLNSEEQESQYNEEEYGVTLETLQNEFDEMI